MPHVECNVELTNAEIVKRHLPEILFSGSKVSIGTVSYCAIKSIIGNISLGADGICASCAFGKRDRPDR